MDWSVLSKNHIPFFAKLKVVKIEYSGIAFKYFNRQLNIRSACVPLTGGCTFYVHAVIVFLRNFNIFIYIKMFLNKHMI